MEEIKAILRPAEVDRRLRELRSFRRELVALIVRSAELSARCDEARICSIVEEAPALRSPGQAAPRFSRRRSRPARRP